MSLLSYREALDRILALALPLRTERVPLLESAGRVLAAAIPAPWPMPRFDNSSMDGFALRAEGNQAPPAVHTVVGESAAGRRFEGSVGPGEAIRISTGAAVPAGLNAVVPVEVVRQLEGGLRIVLDQPARPEVFIRRRGSDVAEGQSLFGAGSVITPAVLAFLAGYNVAAVEVFARPRVAILTSGEELKPHGATLGPSDIVASSLYYLERELAACGCEPRLLPIAPDDPAAFTQLFADALQSADFVVTTAGVSVGEHDVVKQAIDALGGSVHFWRVGVRPGKPMVVATFGAVHHFGLPGNPVSTCCNVEIFLKPWLRRCFAMEPTELPLQAMRLATDCPRDRQRLFFVYANVRVVDGAAVVEPLPNQNSGNLLLAAMADALIVLDPGLDPARAGDMVQVLPIRLGL